MDQNIPEVQQKSARIAASSIHGTASGMQLLDRLNCRWGLLVAYRMHRYQGLKLDLGDLQGDVWGFRGNPKARDP